jgi:hypothetical protein
MTVTAIATAGTKPRARLLASLHHPNIALVMATKRQAICAGWSWSSSMAARWASDDAAVGRQINIITNWVEELKVKAGSR